MKILVANTIETRINLCFGSGHNEGENWLIDECPKTHPKILCNGSEGVSNVFGESRDRFQVVTHSVALVDEKVDIHRVVGYRLEGKIGFQAIMGANRHLLTQRCQLSVSILNTNYNTTAECKRD